ncbi:MAG: hypothetical protein E7571_01840 [Ruminococcaceae bacterium]|jgi:rubrerythrin|nr:hypothetical protein [Oscillospiraceae bacterium]
MSKSFKKVVACLLAVLMVMFSAPISALAVDTTEYHPDIQIQFGTLFDTYGDNATKWVDNYADGYFENAAGRNASYDYSVAGISGPQLKATGSVSSDAVYSVSGLTIEAADTAKVLETDAAADGELDTALASDYNLKAGDAFTITVRMDNVPTVFVGNAEICYSDNIEPLYGLAVGSGKSATYNTGTAAQLAEAFPDDFTAEDAEFGTNIFSDQSAGALYTGVDSVESCIRTDFDGVKYLYLEDTATGADWSKITNSKAVQVIDENGDLTDMEGKSIMATFTFILKEDISASNPLQFWIHNGGKKAHTKDNIGTDVFSGFSEGGYSPSLDNTSSSAYTTYEENRFVSATNQFGAEEENFGSRKMTFMGVNQNVQSAHVHTPGEAVRENEVAATCTTDGSYDEVVYCTECGEEISRETKTIDALQHDYVSVVTPPTCTEQGYTTYTCSRGDSTYVDNYTDPTGHTLTPHAEVPATCTEDGTEAYWECTVCHSLFSDAEGQNEISNPIVINATDHAYEISAINWDTLNTETGKVDATYVCANDASHTKTENVQTTFEVTQQQTETLPEITTYTYSVGEFNDSKEVETKAPAGHTHNLTAYAAVPATCTEDGSEAYWVCSGCGKMFSDADATNEISNPIVIPAPGHTPGQAVIENEVPASCTAEGSYDEVVYCTVCNAEISRDHKTIGKLAHTPGEAVKENEVPATKTTDGSYDEVVYCTECNTELSRESKVIPATGIIVTVPKYEIGGITINGKELDGTKVNDTPVPYGTAYTLAVTDGDKYFKGWEMNGKIVSEDATFTSYAYADVTVTPVFEVPDSTNITVVFYDKFGNKVKEYKDLTAEQYQATIASDGIPTAQSYPSSRFVEWDTAEADILALTESKTIWAVYEDVESTQKFTVTVKDAEGADITATALDTAGFENGQIPYDTKVTVYNENAKGWAIGGTTVSTEDTYSFFVGADVEITMLTDVAAEPTTTIIGANRLTDPSYRYNIMATRNVPAGYELVDYGFVYGKNLTEADLVIENEGKAGTGTNSGNVKVARAATKNTASNEFALNYGIKTSGNQVTAKSFIVVKNAAGVQVIYSDYFSIDS